MDYQNLMIKTLKKKSNDAENAVINYNKQLFNINDKILEISNSAELRKEFDDSKILKEIANDLYSSKYNALMGFYRTSFISLRSSLELSLAYILFRDSKFHYQLWKQNEFDVSWSELVDRKKGIYSYLTLCNEDFSSEMASELESNCKNLYRELSEYVHGKYEYMLVNKTPCIEFNDELFNQWINLINNILEIILIIINIEVI